MQNNQDQALDQLRKKARRRLVGSIVLVGIATAVLWNVVGSVPDKTMKPESVEILGASAPVAVAPAIASAPVSASAPAIDQMAVASAPVGKPDSTEIVSTLENTPPAVVPVPVAKPVTPPPTPAVVHEKKEPIKPIVKEEKKPEPPKVEVKKTEPKKPEPKHEAVVKEKPKKHEPDPLAILEGRDNSPSHSPAHVTEPVAQKAERVQIQLAALSEPEKAEALKHKLASHGINAHLSQIHTAKGSVIRVRVGPFHSRQEADAVLKKLHAIGVSGIIVR